MNQATGCTFGGSHKDTTSSSWPFASVPQQSCQFNPTNGSSFHFSQPQHNKVAICNGSNHCIQMENFKSVAALKNKIDGIRESLGGMSTDIPVPSIVVIGDQSSGKSSLLELLSGIDIPRGDGICTRVPLEMRLRSIQPKANKQFIAPSSQHDDEKLQLDGAEYAVICTTVNAQKYEEKIALNQTAEKIREFTNKISGENKTISDNPIILTIHRENSVDLTLIDLPGLIHFDKKNENKSEMIKKLVRKYVQNPETIMLNVVKCCNETANTASLQMSLEVDPSNERTLIVLTFLDLLNDKMSFNEKFELFQEDFDQVFMVKNRTKQQNEDNMTLKEVQQNEVKYFQKAKNMKRIKDYYKGSTQLSQHLAQLQTKTMLRALPRLKQSINEKFDELNEESMRFPQILQSPHQCMNKISILISQLFTKLNQHKDGNIMKMDSSQVSLSSRILSICEVFAKSVRDLYPTNSFLNSSFLEELRERNSSCRGFCSLPNELHPLIAVKMIRSMVDKLEEPSNQLIDKIYGEITEQIETITQEVCNDYQLLQKEIVYAFNVILERNKDKALETVTDIIRSERRKPFTLHHYYMNTVHKMNDIIKTITGKKQNRFSSCGVKSFPSQTDASNVLKNFSFDAISSNRNEHTMPDLERTQEKKQEEPQEHTQSAPHRRAIISGATSTEHSTLNEDTSGLSTDDAVITDKVDPELHEEIFQHRPVQPRRWDVEQRKWRGRGEGQLTLYLNQMNQRVKIVFRDEKYNKTRLLQWIDGDTPCEFSPKESDDAKQDEVEWHGADYTMDLKDPMVGKWKLSFMDDEYMAHEFLNVFNQSIGDTEENDESSTFNSMNAQTAASWANGFKQNDANATETAGGSFANIKWNSTSKEVETQAQEDNEITDDTLDIFRICVKDILDKSNEDILILKEAIKIAAYWKVVMKRVIDIIPMLVSDRLVEIPFEYKTQNEIHEMVLSGDKDMLHLMSIDKDIVRKARLNRVQFEQITKAKQIMRTIR